MVGNGTGFIFDGFAAADLGTLLSSSPNGFEVAFDFDRFANPAGPGGVANGYIAFGIGVDTTGPLGNFTALGATDFGILFQQPTIDPVLGNAEAFLDAQAVDLGDMAYGDPLSVHSALLTFTPTTPGAYGSGSTIDFDASVNGTSLFSGTFTTTRDMNQFVFSGNDPNFNGNRVIDNLSFSSISAVPEPATWAALSIIGIAGGIRSRRKKATDAA